MTKIDKIIQQIVSEDVTGRVEDIAIEKIRPNPHQPRRIFADSSVQELAMSIAENGLLQPITVRLLTADKYELISGERRLRAFKLLNRTKIPALVRLATADGKMRTLALIENIQRENLTIYEQIKSIYMLRQELDSNGAVARSIGRSVRTVERHLRVAEVLLDFPEIDELFAKAASSLDFASAQTFTTVGPNLQRLRKADKREYERIVSRFHKKGIKNAVEHLVKRFGPTGQSSLMTAQNFSFRETASEYVLSCRWPKGKAMSTDQQGSMRKALDEFEAAVTSIDHKPEEA